VDQFRKSIASIGAALQGLTATQKSLVGAIVVILALVLFIFMQKPGGGGLSSGGLVEVLPGVSIEDQQRSSIKLSMAGIDASMVGGSLMVPKSQRSRAMAVLAESGAIPGDKQMLFENILRDQNWMNTREQNDRQFNVGLQNELSNTINAMRGLKDARVFIDVPAPMGLGTGVRRPTASVTVQTITGEPLSQTTVDAIAGLVAGSKAGLTIDTVRVIDGTGRQRRATSEENALPTTYLEHAGRVESETRNKVYELLSYIPNVVVAVTAQVDVTRISETTNSNLPSGQGSVVLPSSEDNSETTQKNMVPGAVPGVEANQTADIARGATTEGSSTSTVTTKTLYDNKVGTKVQVKEDPRGFPTLVAISVNVPRGFVAAVLKNQAAQGGGDANTEAKEPTDEQVKQTFDQLVKPAILESIKPQVRALSMQSSPGIMPKDEEITQLMAQTVGVSLMPFDPVLPAATGSGVLTTLGITTGGGGIAIGGGGLIDKAVLGLLSAAALGMMFMLVKKTSKRVDTPTAEELVGLPPPAIEGQSDIVGEADEGETAMAGIEVDESQMEGQKKLEQVTQMVDKDAETVARLLNRWIATDD
jgi:flagellar biosynthesis/type III secretory pathway M-ring protein FliF/YscJ